MQNARKTAPGKRELLESLCLDGSRRFHRSLGVTGRGGILHGDGLLGALAGAHAAAGAGSVHLVGLLEGTLDGTELAVLGADGAADAGILIDLRHLAGLKRLDRAGGASLVTHVAGAALAIVDHRQIIHHGDNYSPSLTRSYRLQFIC